MGHPSVYPTGVTIYDPEKAYNGFTIMPVREQGAILFDMNGREMQVWEDVHGFPNKILPGGQLLGSRGMRDPKYGLQDQVDLIQVDWDGKITWEFSKAEFVSDPGDSPTWMARQHHDYQREGNPVGYYAPGMEPRVDGGNTLVLCHKDVQCPYISDKPLLDDVVYEVDWQGEIIWEWLCSDHVEEMGFSEEARNAMCRNPNYRGGSLMEDDGPARGDWMHINSMSVLGPNKWYDQGDARFHPDNIIMDGRETNIIFIIDKKTGKIVWQTGPDYDSGPARALGWIIGQHHAHMIPRGLPGEGNILVFDNGGWAGYGLPNPAAPQGVKHATRDYSRVLEFDPVSLKIVWQYTPREAGFTIPLDASRFYSPYISSAQRLPNGNTLITEGSDGRVLEVTADHEIVWEFINPYRDSRNMNSLYRAYRVPYAWVPQPVPTEETPVIRPDLRTFRMPGAARFGRPLKSTPVSGTMGYPGAAGECIAVTD